MLRHSPLSLLLPIHNARRYATTAAAHGQPLSHTHPHLIAPRHLTPGIPALEYEHRRRKLMDSLPDSSLVVSISAPMKYMSGKIFYKYRQNSDFWYLTGVGEPESAVILEKNSLSRGYRMTLFLRGKDARSEKWEGARTSHLDAMTIFSADQVQASTSLQSHLRSLLPLYSHIFLDVPESGAQLLRSSTPSTMKRSKLLTYLPPSLSSRSDGDYIMEMLGSKKKKPLGPEISKLRAIKSDSEREVMRSAADISATAHTKTMRFARPGLSEAALAAHFEYICALDGSQRPAYVPVVASGENALTIHYTDNNHLLQDGELVLIDAGCEYNGYASDITRTFPISGTFTKPQAALYSAVLSVQKALIALSTPSSGHTLSSLHRKSVELLRTEMNNIGFSLDAGDLEGSLYEHYVGHGIGIDLHESTYFDRDARLRDGMVITIEPGVYIPPSPAFPVHFRNMGIRIEDQVLITDGGPVVLSVNAPKEIEDVEGACQGLLGLEPY